jgi:hypothetical protein
VLAQAEDKSKHRDLEESEKYNKSLLNKPFSLINQ